MHAQHVTDFDSYSFHHIHVRTLKEQSLCGQIM